MKLNIKFVKITGKTPDYKKIKKLYTASFPKDERAPFILLEYMAKKKFVNFWSIYADNRWAGFIYIVNYKDLSYVFYFAVADDLRGRGIGSCVLQAVQKRYCGRKLFLAIEQIDKSADNYSERLKRKNFYIRNGFKEMNKKLREGNVVYELLGTGGNVSAQEYKALMNNYLGKFFSKTVIMEVLEK